MEHTEHNHELVEHLHDCFPSLLVRLEVGLDNHHYRALPQEDEQLQRAILFKVDDGDGEDESSHVEEGWEY